VYGASGRRVATLVDRALEAGRHAASWRGVDEAGAPVASGVYFFRLTQNGESVTAKGVLLK
jgi:flagellar hook assembly protein FlgD